MIFLQLHRSLIKSGGGNRPYEARQPADIYLKRCYILQVYQTWKIRGGIFRPSSYEEGFSLFY